MTTAFRDTRWIVNVPSMWRAPKIAGLPSWSDAERISNGQHLAVDAVFGYWTVIGEPLHRRAGAKWKCRCFCGNVRGVNPGNLLNGSSKSCGCPKFSRTHKHIKQVIKEQVAKKLKAHQCNRCGGPTENRLRCSTCTSDVVKKNKLNRNRRIANGLCPYCSGPPVPGKKHCQTCLYGETAKTFNVTVEEVIRVRNSPCEVCGENEGRTVIDHDHATGKLRGGLCNNCNSALGFAKEDPARLRSLIDYIQRYRASRDTPC